MKKWMGETRAVVRRQYIVEAEDEKAAEAAFPGQCHQASGLEVHRRVLAAFVLDFVADLLALVEAG